MRITDTERKCFIDNLLVRIHLIIEMIFSRPALRHGSLNCFFQVVLYLSTFLITHTNPAPHRKFLEEFKARGGDSVQRELTRLQVTSPSLDYEALGQLGQDEPASG